MTGRIFVCRTRRLKSAISSAGSSRARHWPADFVKICSAWQPLASARSTARGSPPAMERWAPRRGMQKCYPVPSMRKALPLAALALLLSSVHPAPLGAWGFNGHRFITDRAIDLLPAELRPFYQKFRTAIVEHAIDPDTYRTLGLVEDSPRHFLDMDGYGQYPFKDLPHDYKQAVEARGLEFVTQQGTVPWRAEEMYTKLREAFTQLDTREYARD